MDPETILRLKKLLVENACDGVEITSTILQVIFGDKRLVIQTTWRLIYNREIVVASESDPSRVHYATEILIDTRIEEISVESAFNDLTLHFTGGAVLQTFADSEQYEHWYLFSGPREMIIAGPGRLWPTF